MPHGFETSLQLDLFAPATSITGTSSTCDPAISPDTSSATSSAGLEFGHWLSDGPDGLTPDLFGQDPAPANLSPRQAAARGLLTLDISGLRGSGSSASAALSRSLASKLEVRTARLGSTLYRLRWKHAATRSGRWISRLRASVVRTSASDFGGSPIDGWPTPTAVNRVRDEETMAKCAAFRKRNANQNSVPLYLGEVAQLTGWPMPTEGDAASSGSRSLPGSNAHPGLSLTDASRLAGWPSPKASNTTGAGTRGEGGDNLQTVAGWATPKAEDAESTGFSAKRIAAGVTPDNLHSQTKLLVGWATPNARDYRTPAHQSYRERGGGAKGENLNHQVAHQIHGASLNGSRAATGGGGLLNPEFSRWLLAIPATWPSCAPTATRSRLSLPLKS